MEAIIEERRSAKWERGDRGDVLRTLVVLSSWTLGCAAFACGLAAEITQNSKDETVLLNNANGSASPAPQLGLVAVFTAFGAILVPTLSVCSFGYHLYRTVTSRSMIVLFLSWLFAAIAIVVLIVGMVGDSRPDQIDRNGYRVDQNAPKGCFALGGILSLMSAALAVAFQLLSY